MVLVLADCSVWSLCLVVLSLSGRPVPSSAVTTSSSLLAAVDDDDVFTFSEPGRSFVAYVQSPLPPVDSQTEGGHVVGVELEFRTLVGSAPLLYRDPRRLDDDDAKSSPETARRHVTGCVSEADIRVQLKIGMLHVSATYDEQHVTSVSVGQGESVQRQSFFLVCILSCIFYIITRCRQCFMQGD